jgi:hypothetical protein
MADFNGSGFGGQQAAIIFFGGLPVLFKVGTDGVEIPVPSQVSQPNSAFAYYISSDCTGTPYQVDLGLFVPYEITAVDLGEAGRTTFLHAPYTGYVLTTLNSRREGGSGLCVAEVNQLSVAPLIRDVLPTFVPPIRVGLSP